MLRLVFDGVKDMTRSTTELFGLILRVIWGLFNPDPWKIQYWNNLTDKAESLNVDEINAFTLYFKPTRDYLLVRVKCALTSYRDLKDVSDILFDYQYVQERLQDVVIDSKLFAVLAHNDFRLGDIPRLRDGLFPRLNRRVLSLVGFLRYRYFWNK